MTIMRHPQYYIEGGDLLLRVEDMVFRVHSYFFVRESAWFRDLIARQTPVVKTCDNAALVIDGVYAVDFVRFIWVFYNPTYSVDGVTIVEWTSILTLATQWGFQEVKSLCIREMERLEIDPIHKIYVYHEFKLPEHLLIPSYTSLCVRDDPVSAEEGKLLGLETSLQIAAGREKARGILSGGQRSPGPVTLLGNDLRGLVSQVFNVDATSVGNGPDELQKSDTSTVPMLAEPQPSGSMSTTIDAEAKTSGKSHKNGTGNSTNKDKAGKAKVSRRVQAHLDASLTSEGILGIARLTCNTSADVVRNNDRGAAQSFEGPPPPRFDNTNASADT
ncbi:hypothetical protein EVG20_g8723 [Dentipellis fragilis]|uniref:BTB domain-containing protein n=1 Tax=Dentipellis fragilis TaxID=205917 RepID=A0A4Y9Y4C4_9AGAM|nr:hypothetical protein EVG20_g8723 [Dentipellis fragilis]